MTVYSTLCLGGGVVICDAIGLIDVSYDFPLIVVFAIVIGLIHLYGKVGIGKY